MKLLRTIRLDPSDTFVFEKAAEPGEWAVTGTFMFAHVEPSALAGKARAAFRAGLLGVQSLGWSTLVQIVDANADDRRAAIEALAQHLRADFGAPSDALALAAAEEELEFAASLCSHPTDTLIAVHRSYDEGEIREQFRTLRPRDGAKPLRAFSFLEVEGEEDAADDTINLIELGDRA